uniref:Uncharacterized protein n=1 Tax=Myoviridae sp. ctu3o5 TaxID=2825198 RepID=A0A8S5U1N7_9CAUD|nr:MAG TPA: hypothetical protein [Myoviridae sp. ctu3o5]DAK15090.1 MAG TPA: hypothetical protein [Caudoviricetes sp.]DAO01874.1 MAG TPA: hypothetical protein [Caudoviricetes sp.]DAU02790.1 MAG TPA: hypothetical protein [Caudoviricetes sp.]DAX48438.1 MAG TPA: hypothetical protein [Caudoviricetes sp.]
MCCKSLVVTLAGEALIFKRKLRSHTIAIH